MHASTWPRTMAAWPLVVPHPPAELMIDLVGVNSVLGAATLRLKADPPELRVHVSASCANAELAQTIEDEVYALTLSGPAGGCSVRSERRPRIETITGFIPRERVAPRIDWGDAK